MQVTEPCVCLSLPYVRRARYRCSTFLKSETQCGCGRADPVSAFGTHWSSLFTIVPFGLCMA